MVEQSNTLLETRSAETQALDVWVRLLRGHAAIVRTLNAQLLRDHGLTVNDYEALLVLSHAEQGQMRRTDLAESLQLTASGVTRLLDGLERAGFVGKRRCASDARVSYAVLTDRGREKLAESACSHVSAITDVFAGRFSGEELETLVELLGRLPGAGSGPDCLPPGADAS